MNELKDLCNSVKDNGGVYFVTGFSGLFSPHWDSTVRGLIVGLTFYTNRGHIVRSAFEAISLRSYEVIQCFEKESGLKIKSLRVDGGMANSNEFLQIQSDILDTPVIKPLQLEMTILGSAIVAGLSKDVGLWKDFSEIQKVIKIEREFHSEWEHDYRLEVLRKWNLAVEKSKNWM